MDRISHFLIIVILLISSSCSSVEDEVINQTQKFTLSVESSNGGTVSTSGGTYEEGSTITITATPNSEYVFQNWSNGSANNPLTVAVNQNITLTANFIKRKYPLTINIQGEGTVTEEIISSGKTTTEYNSGSVIRLTANPSDEWVFSGWSDSVSSTTNPLEITVDQSKTITSTFVKRKYPLTINIQGEGTVREEIVSTGKSTPTEYNSGTTVLLTAHPEDEWLFTGWSGDIGDIDPTENPIQFNITESKNITATFLNDVNNYFKIGKNRFSIGRVASDYFSNSITCDGVPAFYNHDLTFYSETENEEIYIEFFNNDSDQFKPGEYLSVFSYLNPYFGNQFDDYDQMLNYIDNLSNQELYDLYLSNICSDSEYKLMSIVEIEFQDYYYEVDLEENFKLDIDLDNETYTVSMTGYLRQGSYNLSSEKVELFYKGNLNFEDYSGDDEAEEINDFLDTNYNQSIDDLNLNVLYDSKYHLDGRIKEEESNISSEKSVILHNDNLYYRNMRTGGYNTGYNNGEYLRKIKIFTIQNEYHEFLETDVSLAQNLFSNDNGLYVLNYRLKFDTGTGTIILPENISNFGIYQIDYDDITSKTQVLVNLSSIGPSEYFRKSFSAYGMIIDNSKNIYSIITTEGQDLYGENFFHEYIVKINSNNGDLIWYKEVDVNDEYSYERSYRFELNKGQDHIIFYGDNGGDNFNNLNSWFKIYETSNGVIVAEDNLYSLTSGNPKLNGFYEDDNFYLFYGDYLVSRKVNKLDFNISNFHNYTYLDQDLDQCWSFPDIVGIEKFENYFIFLSNYYKDDSNYGIYSIDIVNENGSFINSFSIDKTGGPVHLFKLSDSSFLITGDDRMCINMTYGPLPRIIKFNFNYDSTTSKKFNKILLRKNRNVNRSL